MPTQITYQSRAVRALVMLHDTQLRRFLDTWKRARSASVVLPVTTDPDYTSLETLLRHVLGAARGYMTWMCEMLGLPDPQVRVAPDAASLAGEADTYMEHVLDGWRAPLQHVTDEQLDRPEYLSRWQTRYCIDAMLEHAVMHPIRHTFQLEELMSTITTSQS